MSGKFNKQINTIEEMIRYKSKSGRMVYQKDSKFIPVSINNINRMHRLTTEHDEDFVFVQKNIYGYVFDKLDYDKAKDGDKILPVMIVSLRDTPFGDRKQAHNLRIRETYAEHELTTIWYMSYIKEVKPVVCDREHLDGGYFLWKSFLKRASTQGDVRIQMADWDTGEILKDDVTLKNTAEDELWSEYPEVDKKNVVLIMSAR